MIKIPAAVKLPAETKEEGIPMTYTYEYFQKSADFLKTKVDYTPEVAIVLGSCLGPFAQAIENGGNRLCRHPQLPGLHCGVPRRKAHLR